jgi:hypothetical protein
MTTGTTLLGMLPLVVPVPSYERRGTGQRERAANYRGLGAVILEAWSLPFSPGADSGGFHTGDGCETRPQPMGRMRLVQPADLVAVQAAVTVAGKALDGATAIRWTKTTARARSCGETAT